MATGLRAKKAEPWKTTAPNDPWTTAEKMDRALSLLIAASRVDRVLRQAVADVEAGIAEMRAERRADLKARVADLRLCTKHDDFACRVRAVCLVPPGRKRERLIEEGEFPSESCPVAEAAAQLAGLES